MSARLGPESPHSWEIEHPILSGVLGLLYLAVLWLAVALA